MELRGSRVPHGTSTGEEACYRRGFVVRPIRFGRAKAKPSPPSDSSHRGDSHASQQHHPYLDTEKPEPATVGGVKGVQFDYIVSEDAPSEEITLFRYTDGTTADQGREDKYRAIILDGVKGETVTIGIGSPTPEFDDFMAKSQEVLDTVKWTGS